ncbi:TetR/AcrR family transcriptional regulator [Cohnella yongneupensis]|uniref:TetR/AcrR family transcriptional regulator n=1 Tax=Cohnella yongneupensis TaxID=425006 RepID=A0ABW0R1W1_9BACL
MSVDRRKLIVDAASQSFALYGYKATTMDQVAKLANVGKGTIYTFFATKEELFDEIMNTLIRDMKLVADEAYDASLPFFDNLSRILYRLLDYREKHQLALKIAHEVRDMGTPKAIEGLDKIERALLAYIQAKIQTAIEKGELKPCDPALTAFVLLKLYLALATEWQKSNEPLDKEQITGMFRLYLMEGIAVK